jgi:methionyl-tRNA formyltransferase
MRIIFMGTPQFSVPLLEAIVAAGHSVVAVYCQKPRPAGRNMQLRACPVQIRAEELGLQVRCPVTLRAAEAQDEFANLKADFAVVAAYGLILPQAILDAPVHGCLNVHTSTLPRWRGAAPIQRAIMAGDTQTGISIMQMDAGLDTGPVILESPLDIAADDTAGTLHDRMSQLSASMILTALEQYDDLTAWPQRGQGTYADKIDKSELRVDWSRPAEEVDRMIRGLVPAPGAWCEIAGERVKLLGSRVATGQGEPGTVLDGLTIACGTGAIAITRLQRPGRKPMDAADAINGLKLADRIS